MNSIFNWIAENYIEITGTVLSLIYLYFSIKQKILLWPFGIVSSAFYIYIYFVAKFYADMGLQFYYLIISVYGWIFWARKNDNENKVPIKTTDKKTAIYLLSITTIFFIIIGIFLDKVTDSPVPYWDSFMTSGAITATWMLARKHLEHWLVWIVVDFVSIFVYISKNLETTAFLFTVYTVMSVVGYFSWKKEFKLQLIKTESV